MSLVTDRNDPRIHQVKNNGQQEAYLVLSDEEIAKGFVRPVRESYVHVGKKVENKFVEFIPIEEYAPNDKYYNLRNGYVVFGKYSESESPLIGQYLRTEEYEAIQRKQSRMSGCGAVTRMSVKLAETYAREPKFYSATFCVGCGKHLPVEEFVWDGTDITVGS